MPRFPRAFAVASLAAIALLGTACAATNDARPTPPPIATATPGPTPTETVTAPVLSPTLPYGGDCTQVLTSGQLDDFLGEGWLTSEEQRDLAGVSGPAPAVTPLNTIGGLECSWFGDASSEKEIQSMGVTVAPADSIPAAFTEDYAQARCDPSYGTTSCRLVRTEGDVWLMARAGHLLTEPPVDFLERVLDAASSGLPQPLGAQAVTNEGWGTISTCDDLSGKVRLEELIGDDYDAGSLEDNEQPEMAVLRLAGASIICQWETGEGRVSPDGEHYVPRIVVSNGGHWEWGEIAAFEGEDVSVEGAESARFFAEAARYPVDELFATDGVNVVGVTGGGQEFLTELAERALAALR